ncbi:MAG: hypothetical protein ACRC2O_13100 [Chitinophagaceae bacterium]
MVQAYNFLASWQLFPEKGEYEFGDRPRSGTYRIYSVENERLLSVEMDWVSLESQAFSSHYTLLPDGKMHDVEHMEIADQVMANFIDGISMETHFFKEGENILEVSYDIMPNGYLRISQKGRKPDGQQYTNT